MHILSFIPFVLLTIATDLIALVEFIKGEKRSKILLAFFIINIILCAGQICLIFFVKNYTYFYMVIRGYNILFGLVLAITDVFSYLCLNQRIKLEKNKIRGIEQIINFTESDKDANKFESDKKGP